MKTLKEVFNEKDFHILSSVMKGETSNIAKDFVLIDDLFKVYGSIKSDNTKFPTMERHLLNMFRLLYTANIPFSSHILELIVSDYSLRTLASMKRKDFSEIKDNSMYAKVVGKQRFTECLRQMKEVVTCAKKPEVYVPIDPEMGLDISIKIFGVNSNLCGVRLAPSVDRALTFDKMVKSGKEPFYILQGILYPREIRDTMLDNMEDL